MYTHQRAYRQRLIAAGLCPRHGKTRQVPAVPGRRHCRACIIRAVTLTRRRRAGLKGYDLCISCGDAPAVKYARCAACRNELNRQKRRHYREMRRCA